MARSFETLRIGAAGVEGWIIDVRLTVDSGTHFLIYTGDVHGPFVDLGAALAHASGTFPTLCWREGLALGETETACPICEAPVERSQRYPRQLCPVCVLEAVNGTGQSLRFYNTSLGGGFEARRADGKITNDHTCWVRGISCHADEAHFGGIVIQTST